MSDEATVQYFEAMENMEHGLHFVQDTFGKQVHVFWPLDVFGHTAYTTNILKQFGYDVFFMSRIGFYRK